MVPEYVSEGMETVRCGGGQRGCIFKVTVQSSKAGLKASSGEYKHTTAALWTLTHLPPLVPCTGLPQGM